MTLHKFYIHTFIHTILIEKTKASIIWGMTQAFKRAASEVSKFLHIRLCSLSNISKKQLGPLVQT